MINVSSSFFHVCCLSPVLPLLEATLYKQKRPVGNRAIRRSRNLLLTVLRETTHLTSGSVAAKGTGETGFKIYKASVALQQLRRYFENVRTLYTLRCDRNPYFKNLSQEV